MPHDAHTDQAGLFLPTAAATRSGTIAARFAQQIEAQLLAPGSRLPSVRACALHHGVNPQTVVAAYDLLQARGLVESRPKRGFFVRSPRAPAPLSAPSALPPPTHATALMRGMFAQMHGPGSLRGMPGAGTLPQAWLHNPALGQAMRRVVHGDAFDDVSLGYGHPQGDPPLRGALARHLAELDVRVHPDQVLCVQGATQALDLIARTLARPGDAAMVEQPGWSAQFAQLAQAGLELLPVPRGPDGPDLDRIAHWARTRRPRLMVVVSRQHNPTGANLSTSHAYRMLQLAREYGFLIVEDDVYGPLCEQPGPLLSAMDGFERTLYISGFSKLLAPGWRVGFVAGDPRRIERLTDAKLLAGLTSPALGERAVAAMLDQSTARKMAQGLRDRLAAARRQAVQLATEAGCRFDAPPQGLFGWVDTGVDADLLAQRMFDLGYLLAPGRLFDATSAPSTRMRLNFAHALDPAFWNAFVATRRGIEQT